MVINLTPHTIRFVAADGFVTEYPASGDVARVSTSVKALEDVMEILTQRTTFGVVEGVPAPEADTIYIVSGLVLSQCAGRTDVFGPATGPRDDCRRDENGRIFGVTRFNAAPL